MKSRNGETTKGVTPDQRDASRIRFWQAQMDDAVRKRNVVKSADEKRLFDLAMGRYQSEIDALKLRMWKRRADKERAKEPTLFGDADVEKVMTTAASKKGKSKGGAS